MNKTFTLKTSLVVAAAPLAEAAVIGKADYKVAAEKCDAMSGDAKTRCVAAAKARYGKS